MLTGGYGRGTAVGDAGFYVKYINAAGSGMCMDVKEAIGKLRKNDKFRQWHEKNKKADLVHAFMMLEPGKETGCDIGFYDPDKKLMTSFLVDKDVDDVEITESKEIFTKDTQQIKPLEEERLKINFDKALEKATALQQEKYKAHAPVKEVVILQNLNTGQVWNITFITKNFQTLNMKVDAETGEMLEDKLHEIFSFDKGEQGPE